MDIEAAIAMRFLRAGDLLVLTMLQITQERKQSSEVVKWLIWGIKVVFST
jgi:hypothetical protein